MQGIVSHWISWLESDKVGHFVYAASDVWEWQTRLAGGPDSWLFVNISSVLALLISYWQLLFLTQGQTRSTWGGEDFSQAARRNPHGPYWQRKGGPRVLVLQGTLRREEKGTPPSGGLHQDTQDGQQHCAEHFVPHRGERGSLCLPILLLPVQLSAEVSHWTHTKPCRSSRTFSCWQKFKSSRCSLVSH